ncbi:GNAT family N-acetyltransferase [Lysobacter sp. TY2-98]|uniref:GNAT family N-acetyltransferase n=1 Tax=Lysobacter sp. TY2-98 TaxID=2290922 RepID=UPI0013B3DC0E|nr:GNAT family N-acetyltransferase [Lysobacter sp. TY2-98]
MTAPVIRRIERHEAARLAALLRRLFVEAYADCSAPANVEAYLDDAFGVAQQTRELDDPAHPAWVVEHDDEWLGVLQVRLPSTPPPQVDLLRPAQLHRIYLTTAAIGRGLGRRLLDIALDTARRGGADGLWLSVWQRAPGPIAVYQRAGFRIVGTTTFVVGDDPLDDWIMQRRIDAA